MQTDALLTSCDVIHVIAKFAKPTNPDFNLMEVVQLPSMTGLIQATVAQVVAPSAAGAPPSLLVNSLHFTTVSALFESISVMAVQCNHQELFMTVRNRAWCICAVIT